MSNPALGFGDCWHEYHDDVSLTADYLVRTEGYTAEQLLRFIEKPWNYTTEHDLAVEQRDNELAAERAEWGWRMARDEEVASV